MKFRNKPLYRGEFFVALTIPKDEERDIIPVDSKVNPDGSYRLVFNVLYAAGDLCFAREHGARTAAIPWAERPDRFRPYARYRR